MDNSKRYRRYRSVRTLNLKFIRFRYGVTQRYVREHRASTRGFLSMKFCFSGCFADVSRNSLAHVRTTGASRAEASNEGKIYGSGETHEAREKTVICGFSSLHSVCLLLRLLCYTCYLSSAGSHAPDRDTCWSQGAVMWCNACLSSFIRHRKFFVTVLPLFLVACHLFSFNLSEYVSNNISFSIESPIAIALFATRASLFINNVNTSISSLMRNVRTTLRFFLYVQYVWDMPSSVYLKSTVTLIYLNLSQNIKMRLHRVRIFKLFLCFSNSRYQIDAIYQVNIQTKIFSPETSLSSSNDES